MTVQEKFMAEAIQLSLQTMRNNTGGPFGAVIVQNGKIIARGYNRVLETNDPTAHAEIVAIREACKSLNTFQLTGCDIYTSCEPCPMCLAAIYWARPAKIYFANTKEDAHRIGFDDDFIYHEISAAHKQRHIPMSQLLRAEALKAFEEWDKKIDKIRY
jgi:guanine deaminase